MSVQDTIAKMKEAMVLAANTVEIDCAWDDPTEDGNSFPAGRIDIAYFTFSLPPPQPGQDND